MFKFKEGDLLELLEDIPENELRLGYRTDKVTTTLGTIYSAYDDGDIVYGHYYNPTYCKEFESLGADLLYRLLSNQLPPITLYIMFSAGKDIILSKADRLLDLFQFIKHEISYSGYWYKDLGHHRFRLRQHPVECFYVYPGNVDKEYVFTLLDVPSIYYPKIQQTSEK